MIDCMKLGDPSEIEHPAIRAAAERDLAAQEALRAAQLAARKLDDRAEHAARDADAAEAFKTGKKCVRHLQAHRTALDEADAALRVAKLAATAARREFQAAVDAHEAELIEGRAHEVEVADELWGAALSALAQLADQRAEAHRRFRMVGGKPVESIGMVSLKPADVVDSVSGEPIARAAGVLGLGPRERHEQRMLVRIEAMLAALQAPDTTVKPFMPGGLIASKFREAGEHAQSVRRGISPDEAMSDDERERRARAEDELRQAAHQRRMRERAEVVS